MRGYNKDKIQARKKVKLVRLFVKQFVAVKILLSSSKLVEIIFLKITKNHFVTILLLFQL